MKRAISWSLNNHLMRASRSIFLILAAVFVLFGCSHKLQSSSNKTPTVKDATLTYCNADQTFVVQGTGLSPMIVKGATDKPDLEMPKVCLKQTLDIDGNPVSSGMSKCLDNKNVSWKSQEELHFTLHPGDNLTPGTYDVTITNPDGKVAKGDVTLKVLPGEMLVFYSDPSIVFNGIATRPTITGSNLGDIASVSIRDANLNETELTDAQTIGMHQSRVQATLAANQAVGTYDVVVKANNGCQAELAGGLQVVSETDPTLVTAIDPTFGWNAENTAVTITGQGFVTLPSVYLSSVNATGSVASALSSVTMKSDTTLTAVVPKDLPPGAYNVIVVNGGANPKVGVLQNLPGKTDNAGAFFVTANAPPVVDTISPLYVTNQNPANVTITGSGFDTANPPAVTMTCQLLNGMPAPTPTATAVAGTTTSFDATLNVTTLDGGTVCVVTVTNADNSYYKFSAVGVSIPSANLNPMVAGPDMNTARRAPAVAPGRATRSARFVYAIGGDDGRGATPGAPINSVETSSIDVYGTPGAWFNQPVSLPKPRTLAGAARIGNFIYVVGGRDDMGTTDSVVRAEVLQAANAPEIVDVGGRSGKGDGIGAGLWYYRVSAVMAANDPSNPGGETLASDPLVVDLRQRTDTIAITLYWNNVPGAASYRVYRNPTGSTDENVDSVVLLKADIPASDAPNYEDATGTPSGDKPRPLGATGNWAEMAKLSGPREALGVAAGTDPADATGATWDLYALGGRAGAALNSVERLPITITVDATTGIQSQTVGMWMPTGNLSAARSELTGYSVSHNEATLVAVGSTYIYAGGGAESTNVDAATIAPGGELTFGPSNAMSPPRQGYAGVAGAGFLFAFGGSKTDGTDDSMAAGEITNPLPALNNWNNNGGARLVHPRYYAGSTVESAFILLIGGVSNANATATTERTVL